MQNTLYSHRIGNKNYRVNFYVFPVHTVSLFLALILENFLNNTLFIVGFISLFMSSCNDWLDVRPSDEIKEEYLFETGNGYRTALNGIYRKLATFDLYGSNLSWGLIDGWGLVYNLDKAPDDGG